MKRYNRLFLPALAVVICDQLSKYAVVRSIHLHDVVPVIEGFFNLVHVRNRGMAFGIMNRSDMDFGLYILVAATIGAILLLVFWFQRLHKEEWRMALGLPLILGGAAGNLIDRIRLKEVIDFLDFYVKGYHWPAFNVADSAITVGTIWIAFNVIFRQPPVRGTGA
ncbi:MAG: signal peptidase II [Pseudomonadota bacterium]